MRRFELRWLWIALGYLVLGAIALVIVPAFVLSTESQHRLLYVRLAAAALSGIVLIHVASRRRAQLPSNTPTEFDIALGLRPGPVELPPAFVSWRDLVTSSMNSRRSWERAARQRLATLGEALGVEIETRLKDWAAASRRTARLAQLEEVADLMERRL